MKKGEVNQSLLPDTATIEYFIDQNGAGVAHKHLASL